MLNSDESGAKFYMAEKMGLCPVCGRMMTEVDRLKEGNHIFVWFKCAKQECSGQWLQRHTVRKMEDTEKIVVDTQKRISA